MPSRRTFIKQTDNPFRLGRESAESCTFRKIEGHYLP